MGTYYRKYDVRIGIVCDTILMESLAPAADFTYLPAGSWRERLEGLDLVLVASVWRGLENDDWLGAGRLGDPMRGSLLALIDEARHRGIPTVFYSKEDPPNYRVFLDYARRCDCVFTSAEEMVPRYREDCGHDRVSVLKFCIDPGHDNPVGCLRPPRRQGAVFSGSWMMKYPYRCRHLWELLKGARDAGRGLLIVDRNSFRSHLPGYRFPRMFRSHTVPAMPHSELSALHKSADWSLNVNSVTESGTMFAARCYELLASGCPVISNYSRGMLACLPEIVIAESAGFARRIILESDPESCRIRRAAGIRRVFAGNTCYERVAEILSAVGLPAELPRRSVAVTVPEITDRLRAEFDAQTYADRRLFREKDFTPEAEGAFDYVSRWSSAGGYGPYFLQDLVDVFKYTDADFAVDDGPAYEYTDREMPGRTVRRTGTAGGRGFCVPRSYSVEATRKVVETGHEITDSAGRTVVPYREPLLLRMLACYRENGFGYTLRRIFFGRQY